MRRLVFLLLFPLLLSASVRPPYVAGAFYPASRKALVKMIDDLLSRAKPPSLKGKLLGVQVPHAGYVYSGGVAAYGFKLLQGRKYDLVILLGPSHYYPFRGGAVSPADYWETPLGRVPVDRDFAKKLVSQKMGFFFSETYHRREHSLEVEVPFLQRVLKPGFKIVPIVIGPYYPQSLLPSAGKFARLLRGRNFIIIISSDLSHYHTLDECNSRDRKTIKAMLSLKPASFLWGALQGEYEACGASAIALGEEILLTLGADRAVLLKHGTSADAGAGTQRVVGYSTVAFLKTGKGKEKKDEFSLNKKEKEYLLRIARQAIKTALEGKEYTPPPPPSERLKEPSGVFVTLKIKGKLRGCIGYILPVKPLYLATAEVARAAAFRDPRFKPLTKKEFPRIEIEISVLTPPRPTTPSKVVVGRDGLIVNYMGSQGVLLPQVPVEEGWDRLTFLSAVCLKARVERDCWRKGARLYSFQAIVFKEEK